MASTQAVELADFLAELRERTSDPALDPRTARDIMESIQLAAAEPEGVTYLEDNAGGVEALWCIPENSDPQAVLLYHNMGGGLIASMNSDRKVAAHIAKATGARAVILNHRRAPEETFSAQLDKLEAAYQWLLNKGYSSHNIASVGHSVGGNLAVALALRLRDKGLPLPSAVVSISPWCDMTMA